MYVQNMYNYNYPGTRNCALCKLYIFSFTQDTVILYPLLLDFLFLTYLFIHNYIHTCISVVHTYMLIQYIHDNMCTVPYDYDIYYL